MRLPLALLAVVALTLPGCLDSLTGGSDGPGPRDYVAGTKYTKWVIELDVADGVSVPAIPLDTLTHRLADVVNKPGGVVLQRQGSLRADTQWAQGTVLALDRETRTLKTEGDTVVLHLMVLAGSYSDSGVLGVTYSTKSGNKVLSSGPIAIFADAIHAAACPPPLGLCSGEQDIWTAVLVHEFGHAMGLVNDGAPMQRDHEDPEHRGHSTNQASVMYYAVESAGILSLFSGPPPTTFDADDKADLCALGGKC